MIHLTHPKWRALRVMDEASVKLLNRMLRAGWFVMPFGMDGVDYFIMRVPTETPELSRYPDPFQVAGARSSDTFDVLSMQNVPAITVLVLTKGERRGRPSRARCGERARLGRPARRRAPVRQMDARHRHEHRGRNAHDLRAPCRGDAVGRIHPVLEA